jgi:hypothetical protein
MPSHQSVPIGMIHFLPCSDNIFTDSLPSSLGSISALKATTNAQMIQPNQSNEPLLRGLTFVQTLI